MQISWNGSCKNICEEQQQKPRTDRWHLTVKVTWRGNCKSQVLRKFNFVAEVHSQFICSKKPSGRFYTIKVVWPQRPAKLIFKSKNLSSIKTKLLLLFPRTKKNFVASSLVSVRFLNNLGADQHPMSRKFTVAKTNKMIQEDALLLDMQTCEVINRVSSTVDLESLNVLSERKALIWENIVVLCIVSNHHLRRLLVCIE